MAGRHNTMVLAAVTGPGAIWIATVALWENEDRFDYHAAARDAAVVTSIAEASPSRTVAFTAALDTTIRIPGEYVEGFTGHLRVRRSAEIYSWTEHEDEDGNVSVSPGWSPYPESNSSNYGVRQVFADREFSPDRIGLGPLDIDQTDLRLVDPFEVIDPGDLTLTDRGRRWDLEPADEHFYLRLVEGETSIGDERLRYTGIPAAPTGTYFGRLEEGVAVGVQLEVHEGVISMLIRNDGVLHHLVNGERDTALATVRRHLALTKWVVRLVGTIVMTIGFWIVFGRFSSALYSLPPLRGFIEVGVVVMGIAVGVPFALLVVASSLFVHSPVLAAIPLSLGVAGVGFLIYRGGVTSTLAWRWQQHELARRRLKRRLRESVEGGARAAKLAVLGEEEREARLDQLEVEETFRRLSALGRLEHGIGAGETRFLYAWGRKNGLGQRRMDELSSEARREAQARFEHGEDRTPEADDRDDLRLLVFMALADGVISALEMDALKAIGERLGMSVAELGEMIASVEAEPEPV